MTLYSDDRGSFEVQIPACKDCGADAVVLYPGQDHGIASDLLNFHITRPTPGFGFCIPCAVRHGWPNLPHERATKPVAIPAAGQGVVI